MSHSPQSGLLRPYIGLLTAGERALDGVWIFVARYLSCLLYGESWSNRDTVITLIGVTVFGISAEVSGAYRSWRAAPLREQLRSALLSWTLAIPVLLVWLFASKTGHEHSRVISFLWFALTPVLFIFARFTKNATLKQLRSRGSNSRTAGIIGATPMGARVAEQLLDPAHGIELLGLYDARSQERVSEHLPNVPLLGDVEQAVQDARDGKLDFVYVALPLRAEKRISEMVKQLSDTTASVQLVTDFSVFDLLHARWASVGEIPTVSVFDTPFAGVAGLAKRIEDLVLGSLILLLISPVMLVIALLVKCTSKGPIFFAQTRYGLNGKPIRVLKFRSMTTQDNGSSVKQATRGDKRITKVGAVLRTTSLDELPQFINVIRGDMSIVGPRPHAVAHNEQYRSLIRGYMLRHKVKPGITGWAQINGFRGETDTLDKMKSRVQHDLHYIENWNLSWDLEIILKTAISAWRDKNAY